MWIPSIQEEVSDEFTPRIGTHCKSHGENSDWDFHKVAKYEPFKKFSLSDLSGSYHVKYTYKIFSEILTGVEYFE